MAEVPSQREVENSCPEEEDEGDETFGQHSQRKGCPHDVRVGGKASSFLRCVRKLRLRSEICSDRFARGFEGAEERVEGDAKEERQQDFWDEDAREEEYSGAGEDCHPGVQGGTAIERPPSPDVTQHRKTEDCERQRQMHRERVRAEDAETQCHQPVGEWCLFEIADAVDVKRDPVASRGHGVRSLCVGGVSIIE